MPSIVNANQHDERLAGFPSLCHTDQGSQFTAEAFTRVLKDRGVRISHDGKGRFMDNIFIERLWRSLKYEDVYLKAYAQVPEARVGIGSYLWFYNEGRPHQALKYRTPVEVYRSREALPETGHSLNSPLQLSDFWGPPHLRE
jgi:putative transposase